MANAQGRLLALLGVLAAAALLALAAFFAMALLTAVRGGPWIGF
jgi:hypothetical protein